VLKVFHGLQVLINLPTTKTGPLSLVQTENGTAMINGKAEMMKLAYEH
jgi:hypothetical protein